MAYMKWILISLISFFPALAFDNPSSTPKVVTYPLVRAYVPIGFDDNDRVQIAVSGTFRNTCHKVGPHALRVDSENKTITVQQDAYVYSGVCLQMFVPFSQVIDVGIVPPGDYRILDLASGNEIGKLPVNKGAGIGPDDYFYAPVTDAYVVNNPDNKKRILALTGSFSDRCSEFQDIKVAVTNDVIVVQPVVARNPEVSCDAGKVRFLKTVELDDNLKEGMYFLHVRALNGQAINKVVDLE